MCGIDGTPDCAVSVDDSGFSDVDDPLSDADSLLDAYVDDVLTGLPECIGDDCDESNPWGFSMSPFMPDFSPFVGACQNPDISIFGTFLDIDLRSEEHTSELQSRGHLVCRLLLEKKKKHKQ